MFFGGHLTQVCRPADAEAGWNWTFWDQALRPLLEELLLDRGRPALVAADAKPQVQASAKDVEVRTRATAASSTCWPCGAAARRAASASPAAKLNGAPLTGGQVLFEYAQEPPPPPIGAGRRSLPLGRRRRRRLP